MSVESEEVEGEGETTSGPSAVLSHETVVNFLRGHVSWAELKEKNNLLDSDLNVWRDRQIFKLELELQLAAKLVEKSALKKELNAMVSESGGSFVLHDEVVVRLLQEATTWAELAKEHGVAEAELEVWQATQILKLEMQFQVYSKALEAHARKTKKSDGTDWALVASYVSNVAAFIFICFTMSRMGRPKPTPGAGIVIPVEALIFPLLSLLCFPTAIVAGGVGLMSKRKKASLLSIVLPILLFAYILATG